MTILTKGHTVKAILTVGIPASGKTTWAEQWCKKNPNCLNINRDDIRVHLFSPSGLYSDYKFSKEKEQRVTAYMYEQIQYCIDRGFDFIISDTNLNAGRRNDLIKNLCDAGCIVAEMPFRISFWEAVKRDSKRGDRSVGRQVIYRMYKQWLEYIGRPTYEGTPNHPKAFIFDIDGTLARMEGRSPFDWDKVGEDSVIESTKAVLESLEASGYVIVIMSGRDGSCLVETVKWLEANGIPFDRFYIRPEGNTEKDSKIKEELFWRHVAPYYDVIGVFDDRPQVCLMWNELGIPLFKVGELIPEF